MRIGTVLKSLTVSGLLVIASLYLALLIDAYTSRLVFQKQYERYVKYRDPSVLPRSNYILPNELVELDGNQVRWDSITQLIMSNHDSCIDINWVRPSSEELGNDLVSAVVNAPLMLAKIKPSFSHTQPHYPIRVLSVQVNV